MKFILFTVVLLGAILAATEARHIGGAWIERKASKKCRTKCSGTKVETRCKLIAFRRCNKYKAKIARKHCFDKRIQRCVGHKYKVCSKNPIPYCRTHCWKIRISGCRVRWTKIYRQRCVAKCFHKYERGCTATITKKCKAYAYIKCAKAARTLKKQSKKLVYLKGYNLKTRSHTVCKYWESACRVGARKSCETKAKKSCYTKITSRCTSSCVTTTRHEVEKYCYSSTRSGCSSWCAKKHKAYRRICKYLIRRICKPAVQRVCKNRYSYVWKQRCISGKTKKCTHHPYKTCLKECKKYEYARGCTNACRTKCGKWSKRVVRSAYVGKSYRTYAKVSKRRNKH